MSDKRNPIDAIASEVEDLASADTQYAFSRVWRWEPIILQGPDWQTVLRDTKLVAYWNDNINSAPFSLVMESHVDSPVRRDEQWHKVGEPDVGIYLEFFEEHGGMLFTVVGFGFDRICGHMFYNRRIEVNKNSHLIQHITTTHLKGGFRTRVTWC